jgi:hypothetical protein
MRLFGNSFRPPWITQSCYVRPLDQSATKQLAHFFGVDTPYTTRAVRSHSSNVEAGRFRNPAVSNIDCNWEWLFVLTTLFHNRKVVGDIITKHLLERFRLAKIDLLQGVPDLVSIRASIITCVAFENNFAVKINLDWYVTSGKDGATHNVESDKTQTPASKLSIHSNAPVAAERSG